MAATDKPDPRPPKPREKTRRKKRSILVRQKGDRITRLTMTSFSKRSAWSYVGRVALELVCILVFVVGLLAGALLHLGLPVSREAAADILERYLSSLLQGRFEIGEIASLQGGGIEIRDVVVWDPDGTQVLEVERLEADIDPLDVLLRVLSNNEKLSIEVQRVLISGSQLELLEKTLNEGGETHLSLVEAFTPVPTASSAGSKQAARPVRVWFPHIMLRNLQVHGSIAGSPIVYARVENTNAKLLVTDKGVLLDVERFGVRASGVAGADISAQGDFHLRAPGPIYGSFEGSVGDIPMQHRFRLEQGNLDVLGTYPLLEPHQLRPLLGSYPVDAALRAELHVTGKLPELNFKTKVSVLDDAKTESFQLDADGNIDVSLSRPSEVHIVTEKLNLSQLNHELPRSSLDVEAKSTINWVDGKPSVTVSGRLPQGTVEDLQLPPLEVEAQYTEQKWAADARLDSAATSSQLHAEQAAGQPLRFNGQVKADLARSEVLRPYVAGTTGNVSATVSGSLDDDGQLTADAVVVGRNVQQADVRVENLEVRSKVQGPLSSPLSMQAESRVLATHAQLGEKLHFDRIELEQSGALATPQLRLVAQGKEGVKLSASGDVAVLDQSVSRLGISLEGRGKPVEISAKKAGYRDKHLVLQDFSMKSLGSVSGDVDFHLEKGGKIRLSAKNLNIARLSETAGLTQADLGGELDAEIDLMVGHESSGTVDVEIKNGALLGFTGLDLHVDAGVSGRALRGSARAQVGGLGVLSGDFNGELAGSPMYATSYRNASGEFSLGLRDIDLATLTLLFGLSKTADLSGTASIQLDGSRARGQPPSLSLQTNTSDLVIVLPPEKKGDEAVVIRGVDVNGAVSLVPEESTLSAALRLSDSYGPLASVSGTQALPLSEWLDNPPDNQALLEALTTSPLNIVALAPERSIANWPRFIPLPFDSGFSSARIALSGSIENPELTVVLRGERLSGADSGLSRPIDVDASLRYFASRGALMGNIVVEEGNQTLGSIAVNMAIPSDYILHPPPQDVPWWTGTVRVQLEDLPLDLPKASQAMGVRGRAEGTVLLERSSLTPELLAELRLHNLSADDYEIGDALVNVRASEKEVLTQTTLTDDYGQLSATARLPVTATSGGYAMTKGEAIVVELHADKYNAAAVRPFIQDYFDEFSGILVGDIHAELMPPSEKQEEWQTRFAGRLKLSDGHIIPTAVGLDMEETHLTISAQPEGGFNVVRLTEIGAKVGSKTENLHGRVALRFVNLAPHSGKFELSLDDLEVTSGASPLARITGSASGTLEKRDGLRLVVQIHELMANLAEAVDDQLIDVSDNPSIEILQYPKQKASTESGSEVPLFVSVDLGKNTRVKNSLLDARVSGRTEIIIADEVKLGGSISVDQGSRFVVLGRTFMVERGLVLFDTGDAADPHLQINSTWTAPNNVQVRLAIGGTASKPTLNWSSDPSLPGGEADVLALVIGGAGQGGSDGGGATSTSLAIAANELNTIEGLEFYAAQQAGGGEGRLNSLNDDSWDSYTAAYQITDELWFEGSYQRRTVAGRDEQGVSGTLDWRFHPQWSLRTEVGQLGTGIDLLWQYRY